MSKKEKAKAGKAEKPELQRFLLISKALADPTRMSVLRRIAAGEASCAGMKEALGLSAATLSHHMKQLEQAGLIAVSREGRFAHASLERKVWKQYLAELKAILP